MSFADDVAKWAGDKAIPVATAVMQKSIERLAEQANTSRFKGGLMPIDTSFLTNSIAAEMDQPPSGESKQPRGYGVRAWNPSQINVVISRMRLGDVIFIGWTAEYAQDMENRYGFMRFAAQNWGYIVDLTAVEYRSRFNAY